MRMMVAGMGDRSAQQLFAWVDGLAKPHQVVPDWVRLEEVVSVDQPDVIVLYLGDQPGQQLATVRRLLALYPGISVIALCNESSPTLVKMITQAGCVDLVLISDCQRDIRRAMIGLLKRSGSESLAGEVIACLGAKGGVGTTMIACNLADGLASRFPERRTILVDLNLYLGDVALQLDINPETTTLFFLERANALEAEQLRTLPIRHSRGFQVIALDGNIDHAATISVEQVVFLLGRLRERYDFVILDCGSSLTEVSMSACSDADRRLIVVTETIASRMGARRRVSALRALDPDRRAVQAVLNRCHDRSPEALSQIEQSLGTSIIGSVSNAWSTVSASLAQGQTLLASSPRSPASTDIKHLVDSLAGKSNAAARRKKAFFNFFR